MNEEGGMDLYYDEMQLGEGMGTGYGVNFDELPLHQVDSSASINSSTNIGNGKKRSFSADTGNDGNKKRFVWPDALHRDFMAAVFDVGLQYATPKEIFNLMGTNDSPVTSEQLMSAIRKFNMFRERRYGEYVSYTELARNKGRVNNFDGQHMQAGLASFSSNSANSLNGNGSTLVADPSHNKPVGYADEVFEFPSAGNSVRSNRKTERPSAAAAAALLERIDAMGEAINAQQAYIANLKQQLRKQNKIYAILTQKARDIRAILPAADTKRPYNAFVDKNIRNTCGTLYKMNIVTGDNRFGLSYVDMTGRNIYNDGFNYNYTNNLGEENVPSIMRSGGYTDNSSLSALTAAPAASSSSSSSSNRNGMQYMHEMRTHMDTHRRLLLQKEDQLSLHNGTGSVYIPSVYASEENCNSGYNSFMDHHKHTGYKYTAEDNRLCYPGKRYTADTSYGTESTTAADIERAAAAAAKTTSKEAATPYGSGVGAWGQSSSSSLRTTPEENSMKVAAVGANSSGAAGGSGSGGSGGGYGNVVGAESGAGAYGSSSGSSSSGGAMGINPITGMTEYYPYLETDLEMDLFSFLLDPGQGE
jgi:SHAQKYF class myb-like DNA-binding protein